ncbi:hypothetical protein PAT3040_00410 [Paenibacillus agaridevorans]|uniref:Uncharacterized protein n=1 Tax=Paenibacillus agaridevorans TaxID=171404 RepID=A0A2R5EIL5_9BACL|nr:hypothetical protein PAT3040_00410 [Paenibacillus agaridevorans]
MRLDFADLCCLSLRGPIIKPELIVSVSGLSAVVMDKTGGPEMNRTSDTTFRKRVLYPLSYGATASNIITPEPLVAQLRTVQEV